MVGPEWWIHTLRAIRHLNAYAAATNVEGRRHQSYGATELAVGVTAEHVKRRPSKNARACRYEHRAVSGGQQSSDHGCRLGRRVG